MTTTYSYDSANRLQTEVTPTQTTTYMFDANGNNTVKNAAGQLTTLTWDLENRMSKLQQPTAPTTMTFTYDGNSFRRSLHDGTNLTKFLNDWQSGMPGIDPILIETNATDSTIVQYTPGMLLGLLSQRRGGVSRFYHAEGIGTIRQLTDVNQAIADTYVFDAWGNAIAAAGTDINPFRYVGKENYYTDTGSSLMVLGVRYYSPSQPRFLTPDPLGETDGWSLYAYVQSRPTVAIDPEGMKLILKGLTKDGLNQLKKLCPEAKLNADKAGTVTPTPGCCDKDKLEKSKHPIACQCICEIVNSKERDITVEVLNIKAKSWQTIYIPTAKQNPAFSSGVNNPARCKTNDKRLGPDVFPHTEGALLNYVQTPSTNSKWEFGAFLKDGRKFAFRAKPVILGHELCGHAWHKVRYSGGYWYRKGHDRTIDIENKIAKEQGDNNVRGHFNDRLGCGESAAYLREDKLWF